MVIRTDVTLLEIVAVCYDKYPNVKNNMLKIETIEKDFH